MLIVNGGKKLDGEVIISGSKNSTLAIIAASLLSEKTVTLHNVPLIEDIFVMRDILYSLGCETHLDAHGVMVIEPSTINNFFAVNPKMSSIRAGTYFMGALLGRYNRACISMPGGCRIGSRPIDYHLYGFERLGAEHEIIDEKIFLTAKDGLMGNTVVLPYPSVGATINIMLAASRAKGRTIIKNAAAEPTVVDTANFLNSMGANIEGIGSYQLIINGVEKLNAERPYRVAPDHIEAGTYLIYAAICGGKLTLKDVVTRDLINIISVLRQMGADIEVSLDTVTITVTHRLKGTDIVTGPYPAFPTDLQQLIMSLMAISDGVSTITETVFENRFKQAQELINMGAKISINKNMAIIEGVPALHAANVKAHDLRGCAALIGAAMAAKGTSSITGDNYISRGYEDIVGKLTSLNANINYYS